MICTTIAVGLRYSNCVLSMLWDTCTTRSAWSTEAYVAHVQQLRLHIDFAERASCAPHSPQIFSAKPASRAHPSYAHLHIATAAHSSHDEVGRPLGPAIAGAHRASDLAMQHACHGLCQPQPLPSAGAISASSVLQLSRCPQKIAAQDSTSA